MLKSEKIAFLIRVCNNILQHSQKGEGEEEGVYVYRFDEKTKTSLENAAKAGLSELTGIQAFLEKVENPMWDKFYAASLTGLMVSDLNLEGDALLAEAAMLATKSVINRRELMKTAAEAEIKRQMTEEQAQKTG